MDLSDVHDALVGEVREQLYTFAEPSSITRCGRLLDRLVPEFEGLALCHLLDLADVDEYRENLARAAITRRYFLRRSAAEGSRADRLLAISGTRGFLDALAAGSLPLARDVAALSTTTWDASWEYEDDFCYYRVLHALVLQPDPLPRADVEALCDQLEAALEGAAWPQLDVARALVARDRDGFKSALEALLAQEKVKIDEELKSPWVMEGDLLYWPRSRVSIEGLALLKLAELLGVAPAGDVARCPALGRLPWTEQEFLDPFVEIERRL